MICSVEKSGFNRFDFTQGHPRLSIRAYWLFVSVSRSFIHKREIQHLSAGEFTKVPNGVVRGLWSAVFLSTSSVCWATAGFGIVRIICTRLLLLWSFHSSGTVTYMLFFSQWRPHFRIALPQLDLTRMVSFNVSDAGGRHFPSTKVSLYPRPFLFTSVDNASSLKFYLSCRQKCILVFAVTSAWRTYDSKTNLHAG